MESNSANPEDIPDPQDYKEIHRLFQENFVKVTNDEQRFVKIGERRDESVFSPRVSQQLLQCFSHGKVMTRWRGLELRKYPVDIVILQQLLWELKPATVFEMGAYVGGSALWFADTLKIYNVPSHIYSVDISLDRLSPDAKGREDITFIEGDLKEVDKVLPLEMLEKLPHPWLITEDSHTNLLPILNHFHRLMQPGDYVCVEDTSPDMMIIEYSNRKTHESIGNAKLNVTRSFLQKFSDDYVVDQFYTDFYGYNVTSSWNGYFKRV